MANDVTIDSIQIEIEADSSSAASNLDRLTQAIDRLQSATSRITTGNDGLNKLQKQIEKLNQVSQRLQSMSEFQRIGQMVEQLKKLGELNNIGDISGFVRDLNKLPQIVNAIDAMPSIDVTKFQQLAAALEPLASLNASGLNSFLNLLKEIPQVSQQLAGMDFTQFTSQIQQISAALEPLVQQAERGGEGLTALAQTMQQTDDTAQQNTDGFSLFNKIIENIKAKAQAAIATLKKLFSSLKSSVTASTAYVGNLNLFRVTMGESASSALEFAEAVNSALGVDTSDWIRYQSAFQSIGKEFGIGSEKADLMSKNLTQLTYDISSFYNISTDTAGEKLQSALSGQVTPMRQLGFAIEEATLKQVALNHGIETSVEDMTQAQKAQLRYVAIMEQAGNMGVLGNMAQTIDTAANGLRVLQARIQQFSRAVGNMLMPVLSAVLPYATAFVQVITEAVQSIANFFGFELPQIDFSGASISNGYDDITTSVDEATKATEKFKGSLVGVDQLNIIGSHTESNGSGENGNQFDLGIELPEYDFLQGLEAETSKAYNTMKGFLDGITPIAAGIATALGVGFVGNGVKKVVEGIKSLVGGFKQLQTTALGKFATGLAAGVAAFLAFKDAVKGFVINGVGGLSKLITVIGAAGVAIVAFMALGNPLGAVLTAVGAVIGTVTGIYVGFAEKTDKANKAMMDSFLYNNGGTKISEVANAFENWANAAKKANDEVIEKYAKLNEYDTKMGELHETMTEIAGVDLKLDEITPADAEALKEPFNELCDYLKTDFAERVNLATQSVADAFKNLNLGESLNAEMQAAYKSMQTAFDSSITDTQKVVDGYLDRISNGEKLTAAEMEEFQNKFNYTFEMSATKDESLTNLEKTLDQIDLSKIDLENEAYGVESIEKIKSASEAYIQSAKDRFDAEMANTAEMRRKLDTMKKYGEITDQDYYSRMDLLTLSENLFATNLAKQIGDVQKKVGQITGTINQQLYEGSKNAQVDWRDWFGAFGKWDKMGEYAQSRVLDSSEVYASLQDLSQAAAFDWKADVTIKNTFYTETDAQMWAIMLKEQQPDLEVMIGRIQDETGHLQYIVGDRQSLIDMKVDAIKSDDENWQIITGKKVANIKTLIQTKTDWHDTSLTSLGKNSAGEAIQGPVLTILEQKQPTLTAAAKDTVNTDVWNQLTDYYSDHPITYDPTIKLKADQEVYNQAQKINDWILKGLTDGMSQEKYASYMSELADSGAQAFCTKYGIHSPSKLFESYGDYMMKGLTIGLDRGQNGVLSSIDSTAAEMERHMTGIGFDVPIAADNSRLKSAVEKARESLSRAQNVSFDTDFDGYAAHISSLPKLPQTDSRTVWQSNGASDSPDGMEATITIYNQIDMDGDTVAEKVNDINARLLYRSNGR